MNKKYQYSFAILRYVHDTTTGEFVNVGVALHAPEVRYANAICRTTYGRLNRMFPGINAEYFKSTMRHIQSRFEATGKQINTQLQFENIGSVMDIARRILPIDDSSLQWSQPGVGFTDNPEETLKKLYDRMVMKYEEKTAREHRTEDDVWRHFKRTLEDRNLLKYFEPKKIIVQDDEVEFQHTWKNGKLHCLETVSFDLSSPDSIRDKAHRWLGRVTSIANSREKFDLYFLVGQPQDEQLLPAFESALSILKKVPVNSRIFQEKNAEDLSHFFEQEVAKHQARAH